MDDRPGGYRFGTTQWSQVLAVAGGDPAKASEALADLCEKYWYPLYAYARRRGYDVEDAQDLTQGFFARLLEKDGLKNLTREGGRFRSFLLTSFCRHLSNERERSHAQKRGGGKTPLSLDFQRAEQWYRHEPADHLTPDKAYERRWAEALLGRAMNRLRAGLSGQGKTALFEALRPFISGIEIRRPYAEVAAGLQMSEGAVKVAVHRLRRRFADLLRDEIAQTLSNPEETDDEIRYLFSVFS
jgi:RNA polymerase sigma-70 factor (ECF subfamily)